MPTASKRFGIRRPGMGRPKDKGVPQPSGENLSGWAGIEDHLMTHDTGEMEDYADDIDTLLVFAGLFSAILTAFLVQTYPMLQPNGTDTTNQLLALSVSTQLRTAGTTISKTQNRTLTTLADAVSTPFSPSTATRWINTLFFLSLVFSLAAALFSILAKQWIREYIKWNSPLALPRENVLVRQIRIEAWEDWQVSMVLSSIPILLELGMVLFLAGVVILLWTLDDVVAKVVTVFVSFFLGAFATFTVMPILSKRCPYKSPTAWAFYTAFHILISPLQYLVRFLAVYRRFLKSQWQRHDDMSLPVWRLIWPRTWQRPGVKWPDRLRTRRDCDLETCRITGVPSGRWMPKALRDAARHELAKESIGLKEDGTLAEEPRLSRVPDYACSTLLVNIAEVSRLLRALAWVQQSSQSARVVAYIDECMDQVHCDLPVLAPGVPDWRDGIRTVTAWCIFSSALKDCPRNPHLSLLARSDNSLGDVTQLRNASNNPDITSPSLLRHLLPVLLRLLLQPTIQWAEDSSAISPGSLRRCKELFFAVQRVPPWSLSLRNETAKNWYARALQIIHKEYGPHDDTIKLGTFQQLCKYGKVSVSQDCQLSFNIGSMESEDYESLFTSYFDNFDNASEEYLNMFVVASVQYLNLSVTNNPMVLEKMIRAAETISHQPRRDIHRCEDAKDQTWLIELSVKTLPQSYAQFLRQLLHIFERSYTRGVLTGGQYSIRGLLHQNLEMAHKERICEVAECPWISHNCEEGESLPLYRDCSILPNVGTTSNAPQSGGEDPSAAPGPDAARVGGSGSTDSSHAPPRLEDDANMSGAAYAPSFSESTTTRQLPASVPLQRDVGHDSTATALPSLVIPHDTSAARLHTEHPPPSPTYIHADAPASGLSDGTPASGPLIEHSPDILTEEPSNFAADRRHSDMELPRVLEEDTTCGNTDNSTGQARSMQVGARDTPGLREGIALEDLAGDHLSVRTERLEERDAESTVNEDHTGHPTPPPWSHASNDSVRDWSLGSTGLPSASAMPHSADVIAHRHAHYDHSQDAPPGDFIAADESSREERGAGARRGEGSPVRVAAVLFQGETGVIAQGEEMFGLTRREDEGGREVERDEASDWEGLGVYAHEETSRGKP